jgi:hypothetical protein
MFNPDTALYVTLRGREVLAVAKTLFKNAVLDHNILIFDAKRMFCPSPKAPPLIPENEGPLTNT